MGCRDSSWGDVSFSGFSNSADCRVRRASSRKFQVVWCPQDVGALRRGLWSQRIIRERWRRNSTIKGRNAGHHFLVFRPWHYWPRGYGGIGAHMSNPLFLPKATRTHTEKCSMKLALSLRQTLVRGESYRAMKTHYNSVIAADVKSTRHDGNPQRIQAQKDTGNSWRKSTSLVLKSFWALLKDRRDGIETTFMVTPGRALLCSGHSHLLPGTRTQSAHPWWPRLHRETLKLNCQGEGYGQSWALGFMGSKHFPLWQWPYPSWAPGGPQTPAPWVGSRELLEDLLPPTQHLLLRATTEEGDRRWHSCCKSLFCCGHHIPSSSSQIQQKQLSLKRPQWRIIKESARGKCQRSGNGCPFQSFDRVSLHETWAFKAKSMWLRRQGWKTAERSKLELKGEMPRASQPRIPETFLSGHKWHTPPIWGPRADASAKL